MKYDNCLIQVPYEHAFGCFGIVGGETGIADYTACRTGMCMTAATCASALRGRRRLGRYGWRIGRYRQRRIWRMRMCQHGRCGWMCFRRAIRQSGCDMKTLAAARAGRANIRRITGRIIVATVLLIIIRWVFLLNGAAKLAEIVVTVTGVQLRCIVIGGRCGGGRTRITRRHIGIWWGDFWRSCGIWRGIRRVERWRILLHAVVVIVVILFVIKWIAGTLQCVQARWAICTK